MATKRIKKSYIAPADRDVGFPRKALTRAVAGVDEVHNEEHPAHRVLGWDVAKETLLALADTRFFLEATDVWGSEEDFETRFDGWAFDDEDVALELFKILKLRKVTCWVLEVRE